MKLLLHACCGPCSLEPVRLLEAAGYDITIAYSNSNIHPEEEYSRRLFTISNWVANEGLNMITLPYDPQQWDRAVGNAQGEDRCRACYRLRLESTAFVASEMRFDHIATTLSVSPYQHLDIINDELDRAAQSAGITAVMNDFRPYYPQATRRSRELGMYRQNYCGCQYSIVEAEEERRARKEARRAEKERKRAAKTGGGDLC